MILTIAHQTGVSDVEHIKFYTYKIQISNNNRKVWMI